jgi:metallo-beta-lactamase family protein
MVGFQAEGTLGRQILDGERNVIIRNRPVTIRANVRKSSSMSAHADQPKLINWLSHIKGVKKIFLTHGEDGPRDVLKSLITERLNIEDIALPHMNELKEI